MFNHSVSSWGPPFSGTCFLWADRRRMTVPWPVRATRLDTSYFRSHRWPFSHWGCDDEQLSDLHQRDGESAASPPCAARYAWGGPQVLSETHCPASPPSPCLSDWGTCSHREPRETEERDNKSTSIYPGEQGWIPILSILRCTHPIQTTYVPDPVHSKKKKKNLQSPKPKPSINEGEGQSSVFKHREENRSPPSLPPCTGSGRLGFTLLSCP